MRQLAISLIVVIAVATFSAQQPDSSVEPSFRSASSELVVLPVTVTDKQGRFVSDLPTDRFLVYDNGQPQAIALFSNEDTPVSIALVIDNSGSMSKKFGEMVAATAAFARSSNPHDELFALEFNDTVQDALRDRPFLLARDVAELQAAMSALVPRGRTALYDGLIAGLDRLDHGTRPRKVIVAISDGGDNASQVTLDAVLLRARRSNAAIYTIGLFERDDPDANPRVLKALAAATGGERFLPRSPALLLQACERIAREIRSGYTIAYEPPARDGTYHRVRVQIAQPDDRKLTVKTRPGYFAAGQRLTERNIDGGAPNEGRDAQAAGVNPGATRK
jgi:Ca-activated chloride channel family protein